jgi:hypothetical protein
MKPIEMYASKANHQDSYFNVFTEDYLYIFDILEASSNPDYSFLKKIKSSNDSYYLYLVFDYTNNITKIGKSNGPYRRVYQHAVNFMSYGNSSMGNVECIWSRRSFHDSLNIEREILNEFRNAFPYAKQICSEFFIGCNFEDVQRFFINFLKKTIPLKLK